MKLVFDTETTGLLQPDNSPLESQPRIIEVGLVVCDDSWSILDQVNILINPGFALPEEITKITGLKDSDLQGKPSFAAALPEIEQLFIGARSIYAHNLPFDRGMLVNELRRIGREFSFPYPPDQVCTAAYSQEVYGKRMRLIHLYEDVMGKPLAQTHRALDDAYALWEVCVKLGI